MGLIKNYGLVTETDSSTVLLLDGDSGTKTIKADNILWAIAEKSADWRVHRNTYRGKYLGSSVTSAQLAAIRANTFTGMLLGDYWTINGVNWRIWDINYWQNTGDTAFTRPHLVVLPDTALYNAKMNETNTTEGGYVSSDMRINGLENAKTAFKNAFPDMILTHRDLLVNAVTDGHPSAGAWYDSEVDLPNEMAMYGAYVHTPANDGQVIPYSYTINHQQLALAQMDPSKVNIRRDYWLRDVVSAALFADVTAYGPAYYYLASYSCGVRPWAAVG